MIYRHRFTVQAPLAAVADFHSRASSMAAITPPPVKVQMQQAPEQLQDGDRMDFTLSLGPLPVAWSARIENVSSTGFTDRQLEGPFKTWVHRHTFVPLDPHTTRVEDDVQLALKPHPWWGLVGLFMWLNLPVLFAFRGWKTRRLLNQ